MATDTSAEEKPQRPGAGPLSAEPQGFLCPERLAADRWLALLVFALSFAYLWMFRRYTAIDPDEGIILQGAQRVLEGQVLYRDFFSFLTPGSYYFLALVFRIFGSSMVVAHTVLVVYGALFSVFTFLMARRVCQRWVSLAMALLATTTCLPWRFLTLHNWDSTLWTCASVYCAIWLVQKPHWGWAFAAGTFASLTALFEQSKGAGLILGLGLGFVILHWLGEQGGRLKNRCWVALAAGLAWPLVPVFLYFGVHHALPAMLRDWVWPLQHYSAVNRVGYGYQDWSNASRRRMFGSGPWLARAVAFFSVIPCFIIPVLPLIAIILLIYWTSQARKGILRGNRAAYYIVTCSCMAGLLTSIIVARPNIIHFVHLSPIYYLVLAWTIEGTDIHGELIRPLRPVWTGLVLTTFLTVGMAFLMVMRNAKSVIRTRRGVLLGKSSDAVVSYLDAHVPAGSKILVYPYMPIFYYLTATFSPTRFEYIQPGMHTRRQLREVIQEVSRDGTPAVLLDLSFVEKIPPSWPSTPLRDIAYDPVTDFILSHYHPCKLLVSGAGDSWRYEFMVRNGLPCSEPYPKSQTRSTRNNSDYPQNHD